MLYNVMIFNKVYYDENDLSIYENQCSDIDLLYYLILSYFLTSYVDSPFFYMLKYKQKIARCRTNE